MLPELPTSQVIRTLESWLLAFGAACLWGGGQMVSGEHPFACLAGISDTSTWFCEIWSTDARAAGALERAVNLNQMCEAAGYGEPAAAVSLFAVGNGLGRLMIGPLSDLSHRKRVFPRPAWHCLCSLLMAAAHAILALATEAQGLYLGVFLVGGAFGAMFTLDVVVISELYGLKHHGSNYMLFNGVTSVFGTLGVAKYITQSVYASHIEEAGERACHGQGCFALTHWIVAGMCCLAVLSQAVVAYRTRALYGRIWRQQAAAMRARGVSNEENGT